MGGENGVTFTFTRDGRASGEAYVRVATSDDKMAALGHNREHIGSRYIEGTKNVSTVNHNIDFTAVF